MTYTKGSVLRATLDFIGQEMGPATLQRVLDGLPAPERAVVEGAAPTDEVPLGIARVLWQAADGVLAPEYPDWAERAGAHSIDSMGVQLYGGIVRKASPLEFLNQRVSLFRLFYHSGEMEVVEHEPGRAVLRLVGFEDVDPLFCRRQTGGLRRVLEIAGGEQPTARHVRCVLEQDAFCEWEMAWKT